MEEPLGLAKRKTKDHTNRQSRLDRDVRVGALAAGFAVGRSTPSLDSVLGEPDGHVTTPCVAQPRTSANYEPGIETSRTCIGCASDTSWAVAPDRGWSGMMRLDQEPCTNAAYAEIPYRNQKVECNVLYL